MSALIAFAIFAIAAITITYKTYVGYGDYSLLTKISFALFLILGWSSVIIGIALHRNTTHEAFLYVNKGLYFLFGFVALLFVITITRDIIWIIVDLIRRAPMDDIKNPPLLAKINLYTILACLLICIYGVYEAHKFPAIITYDIVSPKIKKETKVVMLADTHIDTDVSTKYITNLVNRVNDLKPDAIVLVGDIIDNSVTKLYTQAKELEKLKAKEGVYVSLGNHEFYSGPRDWTMKFAQMRFNILINNGKEVADTGLFISGIPDINAATAQGMKINIDNALHGSKDKYVLMLSHDPQIAEGLTKDNVDLQLSAHTHGGQVFPFHFLVKQANQGRLAGFYDVEGIKMYITRGTRYWGIPMRILAPSEITIFNFKPEETSTKE